MAHVAAIMGEDSLLAQLGEFQADFYARNKRGEIPLHVASTAEVVKTLVEEDSDMIEEPDNEGNTPIFAALKSQPIEVKIYLLASPPPPPPPAHSPFPSEKLISLFEK